MARSRSYCWADQPRSVNAPLGYALPSPHQHTATVSGTASAAMQSLITSHSLARWGLPLALFVSVFGVFKFFDDKVSAEVRQSLSTFLQSYAYEPYLGALPEVIQNTFNRIFGTKHLSRRCIIASVVLSVFSLFLTFVISFMWNYADVINLNDNLRTLAFGIIDKLKSSPDENVKHVVEWFSKIPNYVLWPTGAVIWMSWCLLPDYIALLKIRIILIVMRYTSPNVFSLMITGMVDFIIGIWVFIASLTLLQTLITLVAIAYYGSSLANFQSVVVGGIFIWGVIFAIEGAILSGTAILFFGIPLANLFWASMIPSIWLWAYIVSSLLTRMLLRSMGVLRWLVYFSMWSITRSGPLGWSQHPSWQQEHLYSSRSWT